MDEIKDDFTYNKNDVRRIFTRGTGKGGQHKNTTDSCVVLTHMPTGIEVKIDGRNQHQNEREAWKILEERLKERYQEEVYGKISDKRSGQIGTGARGDKRRTYRVKDSQVIDHLTEKKANLKSIVKGEIELLH